MPTIGHWWQFVPTTHFQRDWTALGLDEREQARLEVVLVENPHAGVVIPDAGGLRKLRFGQPGRGKSGGLRIWYAHLPNVGVILLAAVYAKGATVNLTAAKKKQMRSLLAGYERVFAVRARRRETGNG